MGRTVAVGFGFGFGDAGPSPTPGREPPEGVDPSEPVWPQPAKETAAAAPAPIPSIPLRERARMASPIHHVVLVTQ